MTVRLTREVLYRGRIYKPGEPVPATAEMVKLWQENGYITDDPLAEPEVCRSAQSEALSAPAPPGLVEGGSGAEGEMPGRDSRKRGK